MNDHEILAAWDEGAPPIHSAAFRIATLQKLEARRFTQRMGLLLAISVATITGVVVYAPELGQAAAEISLPAGLMVVALVSIAATAWGLYRGLGFKLI
jgi:hypothetical protein